ncbi:protein PHTF2-like isoform X1 [Ptychodera flava]|uniref:protein PHTF2-like isoform X1 n=1 Tax=Ptychodera flava TaxID=63121 RepID=UPI00396A94BB
MVDLNKAISRLQCKIAAYDKQLWENSVERQERKQGLQSFPLKTGRVKTELIDVDLVSGSTFSKAKPQYPWPALTRRGLIRVVFFPFFYRWWYHQLTSSLFVLLLFLYIVQILSIVVYFTDSTTDTDLEVISLTEVFGPILIMILLGTVHSQVVSTNFARPSSPRGKRRRKFRQKSFTKRSGQGSLSNGNESTNLDSSYERLTKCADELRREHQVEADKDRPAEPAARRKLDLETKAGITDSKEGKTVKKDLEEKDQDDSKASGKFFRQKSREEKVGLNDVQYTKNDDEDEITGCTMEDVASLDTPIENLDVAGDIILASQDDFSAMEAVSQNHAGVPGIDKELDTLIQKSREAAENSKSDSASGVEGNANQQESQFEHERTTKGDKDDIASLEKVVISNLNKTGIRRRHKEDRGGKPVADKEYIPSHEEVRKNQEELRKINSKLKTLRVPPYKKAYSNNNFSSGESDIDSNSPDTPPPERDNAFLEKRDSDLEDHSWTDTGEEASESESDSVTEETDHDNGQLEDEDETIDSDLHIPTIINSSYTVTDKDDKGNTDVGKMFCSYSVTVRVWERNECKKTDLSMLEISSLILNRVNSTRVNIDYVFLGILFSTIIAILPMSHRLHGMKAPDVSIDTLSLNWVWDIITGMFGSTWRIQVVVMVAILERFLLCCVFFFLLAVAERTYRQRFLLAKYFGHVTSARKARKSDIPHFRLNKVRNIKTWLSLRSYLKKRGPQRSIDMIVSSAFLLALSLVSLLCVQLMRDSGTFMANLYNWELVAWCLFLGVFLLRFMTLGTKINKKYKHQNTSALLTEQINLYLHMEQKPHKKEELMLANHVLNLAVKLLNELESPFKISGLAMNPLLYNITRVVVLSAFSGVMTEMLGFKLKLWKVGL